MREIKFRAWLKEKKIMVEVSEINFIFNRVEYIVSKIKKLVYTQSDKLEKIILMQYTGIKDKNGKEIYEGDIISTGDGFYYYEIIFENGSFKAKWGQYPLTITLNEIAPYCEVVGNIYENPELLGG